MQPAPQDSDAVLQLADVRLESTGGDAIALQADGTVRMGDEQVGRLEPTGRAFSAAGEHTCTIDATGRLTIEGEGEVYLISEAGAVDMVVGPGGKKSDPPKRLIEVGADGELTGPLPERMRERLRVVGEPSGYRAAMVLWLCVSD